MKIEDDGSGIPYERQDDIFNYIIQVDPAMTRKHGGAGLGLAITKGLREAMQEKIWVESEPGNGSTFYVSLMMKQSPGILSHTKTRFADFNSDMGRQHPLSIWLAEEGVVNQIVIKQMLQKLGYHIDVAANGDEALLAVNEQHYDLIFMDMQTPVLDGGEMTKKAVRLKAGNHASWL